MKNLNTKLLGLAIGLLTLCNTGWGQALYTQSGTDPSWKHIMDNNLIPIGSNSTKGIKGSDINVKNNLVEVGPFANRPIEQSINIHTVGNSVIGRSSFPKWTRWYQEDGNTQVFRMFNGEHNVRNARANAGRIEAFGKKKWDKGGWHEWVGTYTIVKAQGCAIFQVKNGGEDWSLQLLMSDNGDVTYQPRRDPRKVVLRNWEGKPFHVKIRDNGLTTECYINGEFIGRTDWARPSGGSTFRWGMYVGGKQLSSDALMFVTGATIDPTGNTDTGGGTNTNQTPTVSVTSPSNGQTFTLGTTITLRADATDDNGINRVNFKINGKYYSGDKTSPYAGSFTPTEAGTYTVGARAFDNDGESTEEVVTITIVEDAPKDCAGVSGGSASIDACGVCSGGTTGISASSPKTWYADVDGDNVGDASNSVEDCNQPSGYVAVSGDQCPNDGNKTTPGDCGCGVVEGTCNNNSAPTLSFTKPLNGDTYDEGVTLIVNVIANDFDGSINNVKLYMNGVLVRQENVSTYDWNHKGQDPVFHNMAAGTYTLKAVATDNEGLSSETSITVIVEEEEIVVSNEPIIGDDCAVKNGPASFELNPELQANATSYSWWFSGSSSSVISPENAPQSVTVTMSQYYKGGRVCVGVNSDVAPFYTSYCKTVGVCAAGEELEHTQIEVTEYPNPVDGNALTIEVDETAGAILEVTILSSTGDVNISTTEFVSGSQLDISSLPSGSHILRVVTEGGVVNKRILKLL